MKLMIAEVATQATKNPVVNFFSGFFGFVGQWWVEWGSIAAEMIVTIMTIAVMIVSLAVGLQQYRKNKREELKDRNQTS